ncbi:MAG: ABC transporter substrate-binding protein [Sporichthyaceae bacterium]
MRRPQKMAGLVLASSLILAACGGGDDEGEAAVSADGIKTGPGVTADTITLGTMTDTSGPFKEFGVNLTAGQELWLKDVNAAGGICGRQVAIDFNDHGYKAEQAKVQFPDVAPKVAGMMELLGSPVIAALKGDIAAEKITTVAIAWSSFLLDQEYVLIAGTTYDLEIINGLSHLLKEGLIKEGDTISHIYIDGEYGGNGFLGSKFFAEKHNMKLVEKKVTSTDTDMNNIVTSLKGDGVKAIALTTSPAQTASAASASKSLGLNVPLVGNSPVFAPALMETPAAEALSKLFVVASAVPYSSDNAKGKEIAAAYDEANPGGKPSFTVQYGYALGVMWKAILDKACEAKDLSREGIFAAKNASSSIDTQELIAELDFTKPGSPSTREVYVAVADKDAPGRLKQVTPLFVSDDAAAYKGPFEK